jgi:hypothetical protein
MAFGRQVLGTLGGNLEVTADGSPVPKAAGVTIDWSTVAAVSGSPVTLNDGLVIPVGDKYLRYGQVITRITANLKYGPYDPADAAGGRDLLVRGRAFILNRTVLANEPADEHPEAIEGGLVYRSRIIQSEAATHTLALGPTFAELNATFPTLRYVEATS